MSVSALLGIEPYMGAWCCTPSDRKIVRKSLKKVITTLVYKNANFCRKLAKIVEKSDHNIGPPIFTALSRLETFSFLSMHRLSSALL
jgi:hypothetical protein